MRPVEQHTPQANGGNGNGNGSSTLSVAGGKHAVPAGVAVEELRGGKGRLSDRCPEAVRDVLLRHNLTSVYEELVRTIVQSHTARGLLSGWNDKELEAILDRFKPAFAAGGVRVALCKRASASGTFRWFEFIDADVVANNHPGGYVPQYDVGNLSGQRIKTICAELTFPNGVVVEELDRYSSGAEARHKLEDTVPAPVHGLMARKGLLQVYNAFVYEMAEGGVTALEQWDTRKLNAIAREYRPLFAERGVDVYLSEKRELVSHGYQGGNQEVYRWLEFVDRAAQPNYKPQRGVDEKKKDCVIM